MYARQQRFDFTQKCPIIGRWPYLTAPVETSGSLFGPGAKALGCSGTNGQSDDDRTACPSPETVGADDISSPGPPADGKMPLRSAGCAAGGSVPDAVLGLLRAARCSANVGHGGIPSFDNGFCASDCDVGSGAVVVDCAEAAVATVSAPTAKVHLINAITKSSLLPWLTQAAQQENVTRQQMFPAAYPSRQAALNLANARVRWLMAYLRAGSISPNVCSSPSARNIGS
jgi:hypothetical protein